MYSDQKNQSTAAVGRVPKAAAILAGGLGTRLRPVIADKPKALAPVQGRPFITFLLDLLATAGVERIVFCIGHKGDQIATTLGETYDGIELVYSKEPSPRGTAGALRLALPLLGADPILILNGDSFCEVDLKAFVCFHETRKADATLLLTRVEDARQYGAVELAPDGRITAFTEKGHNRPGWVNAGVYLLRRRFLATVPVDCHVSLEQDTFTRWIGRGLFGYSHGGRFIDIGLPESYARAEQFFQPSS